MDSDMRSAFQANESNRNSPLTLKLVNPDRAVHLRITQLMKTPITYYECEFERISMEGLTPNK